MSNLTRREFLKLGSAFAAGLVYRDFPPGGASNTGEAPLWLGRTVHSLRYYEAPTTKSKELGYYITDAVVEIWDEQVGERLPNETPLWLRTEDGWIPSAFVQPVKNEPNEPVLDVPPSGFLAEMTVPFADAWLIRKEGGRKRAYRFHYGSTHWVTAAFTDSLGYAWYRVLDDLDNEKSYLVQAENLRWIPPQEFEPISPDIFDKVVEVNLATQRVVAYENGLPVFVTHTSTGYGRTATPLGEFTVERKQPSRHMANPLESGAYDLPGVPWVCFIYWTGISLHGTYWHNNYGRPQSHGCINLTPEAAKWIYRWTIPYVPPDKNYVGADQGTRVIVHE